ncbi:MAG: 3-isopropylmalate dehydratase [Candidatus Delongbacteria bacterium]|nr:3-isopropylmalate dehydratase [Candidatus Delongbacteria bacterium]
MKPTVIKGKAYVVKGKDGMLIPDVDTDMIFHNRYLTITDINEMGKYSFDNLEGYERFAEDDHNNEILIIGENFGSGSSRQQAVDCFRANGIQLIIGKSFGAIYERNAINSGMPILWAGEEAEKIKMGDDLEIDLEKGIITVNATTVLQATPFSQVQMDIYQAGDLFKYGKSVN